MINHFRRFQKRYLSLGILLPTLVGMISLTIGSTITQAQVPTPTFTPTPVPPVVTIEIFHALAEDENESLSPGGNISYTISLQNIDQKPSGPLTIKVTYDPKLIISFINDSSNPSALNCQDDPASGTNSCDFEDGIAEEMSQTITFIASLVTPFPPGSSILAPTVELFSGNNLLDRALAAPLTIDGPSISLGKATTSLVNDQNSDGSISPGDTFNLRIPYKATGPLTNQEIDITVHYPFEFVADISQISGEGQHDQVDATVRWMQPIQLPTTIDSQQVELNVTLNSAEEFPAGEETLRFDMEIKVEELVISEVAEVSVPGFDVSLAVPCFFTEDKQGQPGTIGDPLKCVISIENRGRIEAKGLNVIAEFENSLLSIEAGGDDLSNQGKINEGEITWENINLGPSEAQDLEIIGEIVKLPDSQSISITVRVIRQGVEIAGPSSGFIPIIDVESQINGDGGVPQGQGLIKNEQTAERLLFGLLALILIVILLILSFIALFKWIYTLKAEVGVKEASMHKNRLLQAILEYFLLALILFVVTLLGLQNALDREAINSIIGSIIGFTAGRMTSRGGTG